MNDDNIDIDILWWHCISTCRSIVVNPVVRRFSDFILAEDYLDLIDWDKNEITKPSITTRLTRTDLQAVLSDPAAAVSSLNLFHLPCYYRFRLLKGLSKKSQKHQVEFSVQPNKMTIFMHDSKIVNECPNSTPNRNFGCNVCSHW